MRDPQHTANFLTALLITSLWIGFVALLLVRPLHAAMRDPTAPAARAAFCRTYICLALALVPLAVLLLTVPEWWARESRTLTVVTLVRWPLAALTAVVLLVAPLVGLLHSGPAVVVSVSHEQAGDLARLLAKVDTIRAQLRHVPYEKFLLKNRGFHWINETPYNQYGSRHDPPPNIPPPPKRP